MMKFNRLLLFFSLFGIFNLFINTNVFSQSFDCSDCHENVIQKSVHNDAIGCGDCHVDVKDEDHVEKGVKKVSCQTCHEEYAVLVNNDIHHRLKDRVKNPPDCVKCHGSHEIQSPGKITNKVKHYCSSCHTNVVLANPYHSKKESNNTCYNCHEGSSYKEKLNLSVHPVLDCADCHNYISHNLKNHPDNVAKLQKADCYLCHSEIAKTHRESIHGISLLEGVDEAAQCWDCHGSHSILKVKNTQSKVSPANLAETCGLCHNDSKIIDKYDFAVKSPSSQYVNSVHGKIVAKGGEAANCSSCHGAHDIKSRVQPNSKIGTFNIPATCGQCHEQITNEYLESIHWIKAKKGVRLSPVCSDCHLEHSIGGISLKDRVEMKKMQEQTCIQCHQLTLNGNGGAQALNYQDSYHGLAVMRGDKDAAMCVDCHNVHKILPSKHPESSVNPNNVLATCKKCHTDANATFAKSYSHVSQNEEAAKVESLVENVYFWLIVIVIGGMVLHNLIIFIFEMKEKKQRDQAHALVITRFTKNEVVQHLILLTSFLVLVITGFALKYPNSWWANGLLSLGMTEPIRQIIHKTSGVVMLVLSFYHLFYLIFTKRGRFVLKSFVPNSSDVVTAIQAIMYYLRLSKKKPLFGHYDYAEKAEYWALVWGTIVMGITGLILWFPTIVPDYAPVWFIKVSETIHFYEAILASLAILVWHWFFVMFRPSTYPMNFVWMNGKMDFEHYRHHHEEHFREFILEMKKFEENKIDENKLNNFSRLYVNKCKKENLDYLQLINDELESDEELKDWVEKKLA